MYTWLLLITYGETLLDAMIGVFNQQQSRQGVSALVAGVKDEWGSPPYHVILTSRQNPFCEMCSVDK